VVVLVMSHIDVPCAERVSHHLAGFICVLLFTSIRNRNANSQTERTPGRLVIGVQLPVCALYLFPFVQHYGIDVVRVSDLFAFYGSISRPN